MFGRLVNELLNQNNFMVFEEQFWTFIRDMNANFMFLVSIKRNTKFSKNVSTTSSKISVNIKFRIILISSTNNKVNVASFKIKLTALLITK